MPWAPSEPKPNPKLSLDLSLQATGTIWRITARQLAHPSRLVKAHVLERIKQFGDTYSRFRSDSVLASIKQTAGKHQFPPDADALFALYQELYNISEGAITPLVGQVLVDAGYDAHYSLQPKTTISPAPPWETVMEYQSDSHTLHTNQPVQLDFGALGKGALVDIVADILLKYGAIDWCVDAGGDIRLNRLQGFDQIGLEDPTNTAALIGQVELPAGAICGSSGNRRRWGQYHHIMNAKTVRSPEHIAAVWVIAPTALVADGLTTGLYFIPAAELKKVYTFEYIMLMKTGEIELSPDFPGEVFGAIS